MVVLSVNLIVGAVYLPPLCSKAAFQKHIQDIDDIVLRNPTFELVLLGDYNLSSVVSPASGELSPNKDYVNNNLIRVVCDSLQQY